MRFANLLCCSYGRRLSSNCAEVLLVQLLDYAMENCFCARFVKYFIIIFSIVEWCFYSRCSSLFFSLNIPFVRNDLNVRYTLLFLCSGERITIENAIIKFNEVHFLSHTLVLYTPSKGYELWTRKTFWTCLSSKNIQFKQILCCFSTNSIYFIYCRRRLWWFFSLNSLINSDYVLLWRKNVNVSSGENAVHAVKAVELQRNVLNDP